MSKQRVYSLWAVWLITGLYVFLFFNNREWHKKDALRHDMMPYYSYLPAVFIDKDITLNSDSARRNYFYSWSLEATARPGRIVRMSMGVAVMQAPFFLLAHITAKPLGHKADGFNGHYFFFIILGCVFYAITGLWILRWLLRRYFDDLIVAITLVFIACGTNLLYYTIYEGPMSHVYTFFLVSAVLALTVKWHNTPKWKWAILPGLLTGIIILVRPVNGLVLLVPALYNIYSKDSFITKLKHVKKHRLQIIAATVVACIAVLPQFLYWKYLSGNYYFYLFKVKHQRFNKMFSPIFEYSYRPYVILLVDSLVHFNEIQR